MKVDLDFVLVRPAKKSGGDRYEHGVEKTPEHMVLYLPQTYSRPMGTPLPELTVTLANVKK